MINEGSKLPASGTAARAVINSWLARGGAASWSLLEAVYMDALRKRNPRKLREHCTINLARLLRRYGQKLGPPNSKALWQLDPQYCGSLSEFDYIMAL